MNITSEQVKDLYCLYLYQLEGNQSKKDFEDYIRGQLRLNGCDEFLTPLNMDDYLPLTESDICCLEKWKLI